jgi:outer membrane receptor protein involved in Fe transport
MIWGKNVANKFYITNRNFGFDGVAQYIGMPATYGVTLSMKI